jgi:4-hydroxy-2-oxoheptanedioate aldolase
MNGRDVFYNPLEAGSALKGALARGETCIGSFLKIPSPDLVEVLGGAGLAFVVADAEHGSIGPEMCQQMVRAADAARLPLLVRIGESSSAGTVCRFLDTGVSGVMLPRISAAEHARSQVASLFHPPFGSRGLAGGRWAGYGAGGRSGNSLTRCPAHC